VFEAEEVEMSVEIDTVAVNDQFLPLEEEV
jgi:hypothetical protein